MTLAVVSLVSGVVFLTLLVVGLCKAAAMGDEQIADVRDQLYPPTGDVSASTQLPPKVRS